MEAAYKSYRSLTRVDFRNGSSLGETDNTAQQQAALARLTELGEDWSDLYDASVRLSDRYLGSVVDMIRASPMWDQTLFILVADHGEEFNEHGGWVHDQSVYEELLRVPLIIKFPNSDWAGRRVAAPVSLLDIVPTLAEYLGEPSIATNARGRSLIPLIEGGAPADPDEFFIAGIRHNVTKYYRPWKESRGDINIALRHDQYKAIWNVEPDTLELYDLQADPGERTNLAEQNRQLAAQLRAAAQRWYEQCASTGAGEPGRAPDPMSAEALERLRGLGYVD
jgi:arylsulfatase A-like enzyme